MTYSFLQYLRNDKIKIEHTEDSCYISFIMKKTGT